MLYEHGHANPGAYTPRQCELYLNAIARREKLRRREHLIDMRASRASDEQFERFLRMFDR